MRKAAAILLLLFSLILLVGCNSDQTANYYKLTVTGDNEFLREPLKSSYKEGATVKIKVPVIMDASVHVFVNGKEISETSYNSESRYVLFEFRMPGENVTVHLTLDQFYGRDEYSFQELYSWTEYFDELSKVAIRVNNLQDSDGFIECRYSYKKEDIENFASILEQRLLKDDSAISEHDENKYEYVFVYTTDNNKEASYNLNFYEEILYWNDFSSGQDFKFKDASYKLPKIENPDLVTYMFKGDYSAVIKSYVDAAYYKNYEYINYVEFIPYTGDKVIEDAEYYIDSKYGKINLLTPSIFELNGEYYEIVKNEKYWAYKYCY